MYCSECGNEIDKNDRFCINCGHKNKGEINNSNFQFECNNCGEKISIDDAYCPNCSEEFIGIVDDEDNFYNSNQENINNPKVREILNPRETKNSSFWNFKKIIYVIIIISLIVLIVQNPNNEASTSKQYYEPTPVPTIYLTQADKNIQTIEQIAKEYYSTHTYQNDNVFDCDNMAQDVWNMLKTKGINSKLVLGNIDHFGPLTLDDVNHVWLIAEVSPEEWLAIETTGGFIVYSEDNDQYYKGYFFSNPKNYRDFLDLYNDYNFQYADYENERQYYNQLVEIYNNANYYEQIQLESALIVTKNNLEIKEKRASETRLKMEAILKYG